MNGDTHVVAGVGLSALASSLWEMPIKSPLDIGIAFTLSICGSLMPDIDTYRTKRYRSKIFHGVYNRLFLLSIAYLIFQSKNIYHAGVIIGSVIFGISSKHRMFSHTIFGFALYTYLYYLGFGSKALYYGIGYLSHLLLDSFTEQGIKLFSLKH